LNLYTLEYVITAFYIKGSTLCSDRNGNLPSRIYPKKSAQSAKDPLTGVKNGLIVGIPSNIAVNVAEEDQKKAAITRDVAQNWTPQPLHDRLIALLFKSG
jgi:hypothetical protein